MFKRFTTPLILYLAEKISFYDHDLSHQLAKKATHETIEFIEENNLNSMMKLPAKTRLYTMLNSRLKDGLILEFGVDAGKTINEIAKLFPNRTVYGFDTFTGLPEDWITVPKGHFNHDGKLPVVESNVKLVKGLIEETLPSFKTSHTDNIALLHIDTDLYSSAKTILTELQDQIQDTFIVFDEYWNFPNWKQEEYKAFTEFIAETGKTFDYVSHNGNYAVLVKVH